MGVKETTYTVRIDAELADLKEKVGNAKIALDGLLKSGNAPKGLIAAFERIDNLLGRISDQAKMAPSKGMFSSLEKDVGKAGLAFGDLMRHIEALGDMGNEIKLDLFPPEERAKIEAAIKGLTDYGKALVEIAEKEKALEKARKASEGASGAAKKAKQDKAAIKLKRDRQVAKKQGKEAEIATLDPEKDATKIARLQTEIAELDIVIKGLNKDLSAASSALTETNKTAANAAQAYEELSGELAGIKTDRLKEMRAAAAAAGVSIEEIDGEEAAETMKRLSAAMQSFSEGALTGLPSKVSDANDALKESSSAFNDMTDSVRDAADAHAEFSEQQSKAQDIQKRIKDFLGLAGATKVLSASFRKAFEATKELDAAMTEIAVVTDFNISDMWEQLPEYTKRANELGISITQAYNASALFYQQGLKTNEVVELSNETLKMAKIAGLDAAEATDRMTAALRGFNMELDAASAQKIADVYSELAAITASDVDEISTAMTKTASIASSAGMEFETTAAFLSQIIETTRESAETAGTAMKTVIARFQELKKSPDEIGEIDGEIVDANAIEGALRSVGVSLRDSSGQFRELDEVFLELSSKWDSLDKNTQRYIATIAAGSRQQSRFIAMMQDYERTQELVAAANNSAGASAKQYEKTMESLETKLTQLENAWNEFSTSLLNNEAIKMGVDLLTLFITSINKATSAFDGWIGSISKIGMILALFRVAKAIFNQFSQKITAMFTSAGEKIGEGIITGMNQTKKDVIAAATSVGRKTTQAARSGAREASTTTAGTTEEAEAPQELTRGQKIGRAVGRVVFSPITGAKKVAGAISRGNKAMAKKVLSLGQDGQEMMDAEMAGGYAQHGAEQRTKASEAFAGAEVGAAVSGIKGIGKEMNALALPLDEIGKQYQAQMEAMGQSPDEVAKKWAEMRAEFEEGTVSAKEALATIDASLGAVKPGEKLQVSAGMKTESAERAVGPVEMTKDVEEYMAASRTDQGLTAIAGAEEGASLSGTLAGTELGGEMAAIDLPLAEIEKQYKEKMAAMNISTDEITASWQELNNTITSGQSTASQALDAINQKMDEAAQKALEAQQAAGGGTTPTAAMSSASAGITITKGMQKEASEGEKAKKAKAKVTGASKDTQKKAKAAEQQKKNQKQEQKVADKQEENTKKAVEGQKKMVDAYKKTGEAIANMGAGLSMAGAGAAALGSKFEEAGYDKTAEVFNTMGSVLGGVGSAMSIVGSIMSFLTPLMGALTASTTAGTAATGAQTAATGAQTAGFWAEAAAALGLQGACWPLLLITLAIVAAMLILVLIIWAVAAAFDAAAKASPEGQLKAAEEAAAAAAETAEQAAEAYQELVEAFDELDGKYKALEELTEGTKEWNDAVREINKSVLDLIQKYPGLAKLIKNEGGVLTLDVESAEVQNILKQSEEYMVAAQANSIMAQSDVIDKQNDVLYDKTVNDSDYSGGDAIKMAIANKGLATDSKKMYQDLAAAVVDGALTQNGDDLVLTVDNATLQEKYGLKGSDIEAINKYMKTYSYSLGDAIDELRDYGEALQEGSDTVSASMEAIATSIEGIYDYTGWTKTEIENAKEIFGGDVYSTIYKDYESLANEKIGQSGSESSQDIEKAIKENINAEDQKYVYEAIEQKYGPNYKFSKGKIIDSEGTEYHVNESTAGEIVKLATHLKAQETAKDAITATKYLTKDLTTALGVANNDNEFDDNVAAHIFTDGGAALTGFDLKALEDYLTDSGELNTEQLETLFNGLGDDAKKAFANSYSIFEDRMKVLSKQAKENNRLDAELQDLLSGNITEEALNKLSISTKKSVTKKIAEMSEILQNRGLSEDEVAKKMEGIAIGLSQFASKLPEHLQGVFSSQLASLDVTDADALTGFMIDLVDVYGMSKESARGLVESIKEGSLAMSKWNTQLLAFNAFTNAQHEVNELTKEQTDLQWAYATALESSAAILDGTEKSLRELGQAQIDSYESGVSKYQEMYTAAQENLAVIYGSGLGRDPKNPDLNYMDFLSVGDDGTVEVDWEKVGEYESSNRLDIEAFTKYVDEIQGISENMEEAKEGAKEQIEALRELRDTYRESYNELRDLTKEAVLNKIQEEIDLQSETLDATREASGNLINQLQTYINESRQKAANEKTEQALEDSLNRQAYLAMDSSNANLLQLQQEQKTFEEKAEDYRNTLIDQSIQQLQDANEKAFEQREKQISIAERQLELYENSNEFQNKVDSLMADAMSQTDITNSELYALLDFQKTGMSSMEKEEWDRNLKNMTDQANLWSITDWDGKIASLNTTIDNIEGYIAASVEEKAAVAATKNKASQLSNLGFQVEDYDTFTSSNSTHGGGADKTTTDYADYLDQFSTYLNREKEETRGASEEKANKLNSLFGEGDASQNTIYSEKDYYKNVVMPSFSSGTPLEDIQTYSEYVNSQELNFAKAKMGNLGFKGEQKTNIGYGWFPVQFPGWNGFAKGSGSNNGLSVDGAGAKSDYVAFGDAVGDTEYKFLLELMRATYIDSETGHHLDDVTAETPTGHAQGIYYGGKAYAYYGGQIREILHEQGGNLYGNIAQESGSITGDAVVQNSGFAEALKKRNYHTRSGYTAYASGGLANFTGPAWLDGTKSRPEYVLNAEQTERFFSLVDVLEGYDKNTKSDKSGDNYFDIEINVEKLENDYDVEQVAEKIRNMIYEDATYRNVNVINHIR